MDDDILGTVLGQLRELANAEEASITIDADTQLLEENIWSSIDFLDLVAFLEGKYGFEADPDTLTAENFLTPAAVARFVEQARAK
jgi:acyl carrier protein